MQRNDTRRIDTSARWVTGVSAHRKPGAARRLLSGRFAVMGAAVLLLFTTTGRTKLNRAAAAVSVPQKQNYLDLDVVQARLQDGRYWATDTQGQRWPLTLDASLQHSARRGLAQAHAETGALIAVEVKTGKILVETEWPTPAATTHSMLTRQLPAASLFKLVTSAALIEQARITPERVVCTEGGQHRVEQDNLLAPRTGVAECGPFIEALGYSRNAAFAQLAYEYLHPEDLENYADRFGFGTPLPLEVRWPMGEFNTDVEPLSFARAATGFVGSTLTPLGAAYIAYIIANRGRAEALHILGAQAPLQTYAATSVAVIRPETADLMQRMMEVTIRKGTSFCAFHDTHGRPYLARQTVAGKTGTLYENEATISWFIGFAPSRQPEIALSVVLQNGRLWHRKANQVARDWLQEYFARNKNDTHRATAQSGVSQLSTTLAMPIGSPQP